MERTTGGAPVRWPLQAAKIRARERRNGYPIHGYTGFNGGGKTMAAVFDCLPALAAGYPIVSTCRILDPRTGDPHPLWVPLDDFRLLLELEYCDVILDEVTGVASSRDSAGLPSAVLNHLMQLRKADVTIRWTTPNWRRADTGIREVTQALTTCRGFVPKTVEAQNDYGLTRRWKQRQAFLWTTYDAKNFEEWSAAKERSSSKQHRLSPVCRQVVWAPGSMFLDMYDTFEHAITVGVVSERGLCMTCGYGRTAPKCRCTGEETKDASPGMLRWVEVDGRRRREHAEKFAVLADVDELEGLAARHRLDVKRVAQDLPTEQLAGVATSANPSLVHIAETDDTPAVVVDLTGSR